MGSGRSEASWCALLLAGLPPMTPPPCPSRDRAGSRGTAVTQAPVPATLCPSAVLCDQLLPTGARNASHGRAGRAVGVTLPARDGRRLRGLPVRPAQRGQARRLASRIARRLFYQANHTVLVTPAPVYHARVTILGIAEQEEIVAHEFHLEQGLVDGHRAGAAVLLPHHQRPLSRHRARDDAVGLRTVAPASARRRPRIVGCPVL